MVEGKAEDKRIDELSKQLRAAYMREYRKRPGNKERQRESERRYWRRKARELEQNEI